MTITIMPPSETKARTPPMDLSIRGQAMDLVREAGGDWIAAAEQANHFRGQYKTWCKAKHHWDDVAKLIHNWWKLKYEASHHRRQRHDQRVNQALEVLRTYARKHHHQEVLHLLDAIPEQVDLTAPATARNSFVTNPDDLLEWADKAIMAKGNKAFEKGDYGTANHYFEQAKLLEDVACQMQE